jgi:hypothetical protein
LVLKRVLVAVMMRALRDFRIESSFCDMKDNADNVPRRDDA